MSSNDHDTNVSSNDYDPRLRECADKIRAIVKEYDVSAAISLVSKTHGEFVIDFPTWSGVTFEDIPDSEGKVGIRIKLGKGDEEKAGHTAHLIVSQFQMTEKFNRDFAQMFDMLRTKSLIGFSALENRIRGRKPS